MTSPLIWSYSSLDEYWNGCQTVFHRKYVLKIKDGDGEANKHGNEAHTAFENYGKHGTPLAPGFATYAPIVEPVVRMTNQAPIAAYEDMLGVRADWSPCGFFDKDVRGRGKLDVIGINGPVAAVFDWKTGKVKDVNFQIAVNAALVFAKYPQVETVNGYNVWLKEMRLGQLFTFHRKDYPAIRSLIHTIAEQIEASRVSGVWAMKKSGLCKGWCPKTDCENWSPKK